MLTRNNFRRDISIEDMNGDIVTIPSDNTFHSIASFEGYTSLDLYSNDIKVPTAKLEQEFKVVPDFATIVESKGELKLRTPYYYHEGLDFYIKTSNTNLDDSETISNIYNIFCKPNISIKKDIITYINGLRSTCIKHINKVELITQSKYGYEFDSFSFKTVEVDIEKHYNDDFKPVYDHVVEKLNTESKGLILLHGEAGTGKTTLIKHLTTVVNKNFIFVPANLINILTDPTFTNSLVERKDSIIILEDCETALQDRNLNQNNIVSSILQLTDGILSDIFNLKVICTFNNDLTKVDKALLREGRLIAEYQFKELEESKVKALVGDAKVKTKTLASIYNTLTLNQEKIEARKIGF